MNPGDGVLGAVLDGTHTNSDFWAIFDDVDPGRGGGPRRAHVEEFAGQWARRSPGAVACVIDDFAHLAPHLHFLRSHWRRICYTNFDRAHLRC